MLRPRLRIPRLSQVVAPAASAPSLRRSIHHIPPLSHDFTNGVPGLLSAGGFDMAWNQYMALMMEKLNNLTASQSSPPRPPLDLITLDHTPVALTSIQETNALFVHKTTKTNKQTS